MKIEDVIDELRVRHYHVSDGGYGKIAEYLEKHHKELMGLLEGWEEISYKLPRPSLVGLTLRKVSRELSSLIDPKD